MKTWAFDELTVKNSRRSGANTNTSYFLDQDLRVTKKRILIINKAIRDLDLTVRHPTTTAFARTTDCGVSTRPEDVRYELVTSARGDKLWKPRVIVMQNTNVQFTEVKDVEEGSES